MAMLDFAAPDMTSILLAMQKKDIRIRAIILPRFYVF